MAPKDLTIGQIAPELQASYRSFSSPPIYTAWGRWVIQTGLKLLVWGNKYEGVRTTEQRIDKNNTVRIYTPQNAPPTTRPLAALLWIHGGGMMIGDAVQDDRFCAEVARELGIVVVSVNYRLAPEHPFPAPLADCYAAWQ